MTTDKELPVLNGMQKRQLSNSWPELAFSTVKAW